MFQYRIYLLIVHFIIKSFTQKVHKALYLSQKTCP